MDLSKISYEDLEAEMKRRDRERMGPWPKYHTFDIELVIEAKDIEEFLSSVGYIGEEHENFVEEVYDSMETFHRLTIAVEEDGKATIVKFDDFNLVKGEEDEEVIQSGS